MDKSVAERNRNVKLDTLTIWSSHVVAFCQVERRYQNPRRNNSIPGAGHSDPRDRDTYREDSGSLLSAHQPAPDASVRLLPAPDHGKSGLDWKYPTSSGRQCIETRARLYHRYHQFIQEAHRPVERGKGESFPGPRDVWGPAVAQLYWK